MCGSTAHQSQEQAFMTSLLANLDGSVFDEGPTPPQRALATRTGAPSAAFRRSPVMARAAYGSPDHPRHSLSPVLQGSSSSRLRLNVVTEAKENSAPDRLLPPDAHRKRSGSWVKKTPSPRKRGVLSETQARVYDDEVQTAARVFLDESASWLSADFDDALSPSPKVKRSMSPTSLRTLSRRPSASPQRVRPTCSKRDSCEKAATCRGVSPPAPVTLHLPQYVRCMVEEVKESLYIPRQYSSAAHRYTTTGVKAETVQKAMQRRQLELRLKKLDLIGTEDGESGEADKEIPERLAILRDGWLDTRVQAGDVVHLIGTWNRPTKTDLGPRHVRIQVDDEMHEDEQELSVSTIVLSSDSTPTLAHNHSECENMIVLHPDLLLSATAVSSVVGCSRKPYLQAKVKASGPGEDEKPSESLVMGRMLHEVLQSCLTGEPVSIEGDLDYKFSGDDFIDGEQNAFPKLWNGVEPTNFALPFVLEQVNRQVRRSTEDLLQVHLDSTMARQKLWDAVQPFGPFASTFLAQSDHDKIRLPKGEALDASATVSPLACITKVHDVEEDIWSPMYGLKGFVDVTVEVQLTDRSGARPLTSTHLVPLELKTGRSIDMSQHRAQTMLYTLMMSDRYKRPIDSGLLYYSKSAQLHLVRRVRKEINALVVARNELASYLFRRKPESSQGLESVAPVSVPPTIDSERTCSRCYVKDACMLYRKAIERVSDEMETDGATPIAELYANKTDHLSQKHLDFFRHWEGLLSSEETDLVRYRREMWTMTAEAREKTGRCYAGMVLTQSLPGNTAPIMMGMLHCHVYEMKRRERGQSPTLGCNFAVGDPICVSLEPDMLSIAQGHLLEINSEGIRIGVDKSLEAIVARLGVASPPIFRIDREELVGGMARVRYNLAKLFFAPPFGTEKLRKLIVDLKTPIFNTSAARPSPGSSLNDDQEAAVQKALMADDYALIVGMPGTGKTTTVASLIIRLAQMGKTVLLASYTHSAVDTICRKLLSSDAVRLLRLGSSDRIHSDVRSAMLTPSASVDELAEKLQSPNVVATTCLSISHSLFSLRAKFDYCIVDEASQITLPVCIGPLRYADKFVLVGDPQQLPPLVRNERARQGGLDVSLFEMLQSAHAGAVAYLCQQYRMTDDIMTLSNALVYEGRLRCGNDGVSSGSLDITDRKEALEYMHAGADDRGRECSSQSDACFINHVLCPETKALLVDTDDIAAYEERVGNLVQNRKEADIALQLCTAMLRAGVPASEIVVLTPYRQQIRLLTGLFEGVRRANTTNFLSALPDIEVLTADKAQGRDKDVVILSFVRSQEPKSMLAAPSSASIESEAEGENDDIPAAKTERERVGQLLQDVRRINVMLTRARKKLIILASFSTLAHASQLQKLYDLMSARDWTWTLSHADVASHLCPRIEQQQQIHAEPHDTPEVARMKLEEEEA